VSACKLIAILIHHAGFVGPAQTCVLLEIRQNMPQIWLQGGAMPTIKDFGGCKIALYAEDHNPPHVHVIGPDFRAKVRIVDAEVLAGVIPPRHRREAVSWISANCKRPMAKWHELN
jgi:Domain of unknown function (DUF4160)